MSASHTARPVVLPPLDDAPSDGAAVAQAVANKAAAAGPLAAPADPTAPLAFAGTGGPSVVIAPTTLGRTGGEIRVNTSTADAQQSPQIVTLSNGDFAVVWSDVVDGANAPNIKAQVFTAAGVPVGPQLLVNTATASQQAEPHVVALAGGGFVVTWRDSSLGVGGAPGDATGTAIKGQIFTNAGAPTGGEILLNSSTEGNQYQSLLTALPTGGFLATWVDSGFLHGDASGSSIRGRMFDASGAPLAADFLVNTETENSQFNQAVTILANGGFVITWDDHSEVGGDTSAHGIKAQVFTAAGEKVGPERLVNTATFSSQHNSEIVALSGGGFVVTWMDLSRGGGGATGDSSSYAIKAQVFAADGAPVLGEILVNTATFSTQQDQRIIALADGGFVVTWVDYSTGLGGAGGDGTGSAVKAQMFAADGTRVGTELRVNTATASDQISAQITALSDGGFVVVWQDASLGVGGAAGDGVGTAVKAQVYDAAGARSGGELLVNTATASNQLAPLVTALPGGGFAVAWTDLSAGNGGAGGDVTSSAIKAQVFGDAFTAYEQAPLSLKNLGLDVTDPDAGDVLTVTLSVTYGVLVVTAGTSGAGVAGSGTASVVLTGTATQISALLNADADSTVAYTPDTNTPPANTTLTLRADDGQGGVATTTAIIANVGLNDAPVLARNEGATVAEGGTVLLTDLMLDFNDPDTADANLVYSISFSPNGVLLRDGQGAGIASFTQQEINDGRISYVHNGGETTSATFGFVISDGAGGSLTGQTFAFDVTPVNDAPTVFLPTGPLLRGSEIRVNTTTFSNQSQAQIATLGDGRFVVTWTDNSATGADTSSSGIKAQVFAQSGARIGDEIAVNTATANAQSTPQITALDGGRFVVVWQDVSAGVGGATGDNSGTAVKAQMFDADGARVGTEILVNTAIAGNQNAAQITALAGGGFAVAWTDGSLGVGGAAGDTSSAAVKVQVFDADGARVGTEVRANTATQGAQQVPQITGLADGGFVVTWQDSSLGVGGATGDNGSLAIKGQVFDAAGAPAGGEILINTAVAGAQIFAQITALAAGGFVVTWQDASLGVGGAGGDTSSNAVKAQLFDADGGRVGGEFRVNTAINSAQQTPQITALEGGGFVVVWQDSSVGVGGATGDNSGLAVKAQVFGADGAMVGTEILVNTAIQFNQSQAQIAALADGGFVVTWTDTSQGNGGAGGDTSSAAIKAQVFDAMGARVGGELRANTAVNGAQSIPQITALPDGGFVVTWQDASQGFGGAGGDTNGLAVKAQVFNTGLSATDQAPADFKGSGFSVADVDSLALTATLSVDHGVLTLTAGDSGAVVSGSGTASVTITGTPAQINALLNTDATSTVAYTAGAGSHGPTAVLTLSVDDGDGGAATTTADIKLNRSPAEAPTLTGFGPSVTFLENTVNATPQLLDAEVEFAATADFTGGTLTLSGLLAEDRAGVRNEGTEAGQIGLSGADVTFGGVVIGTLAGGVGATLTITFNAAATAEAIDALIQNLTYANVSDTPTATRDLLLNVTDANGADLGAAGPLVHEQRTGAANPFASVDVGDLSKPTFVDLDGDGDLDVVIGGFYGDLAYFENTGTDTAPVFTHRTGAANPLDGVNLFGGVDVGRFSAPTFVDLDGDGDLDAVVGGGNGLFYFENTGTAQAAVFTHRTGAANPFDGVSLAAGSVPAFADLNGDGDLDLVVGAFDGSLAYLENTGTALAPAFTLRSGAANPFDGLILGGSSAPSFADVDEDGDLDLVVGQVDGSLVYFENTSTTSVALFTQRLGSDNPFSGIDVGSESAPTFADLDGDGDLDLVLGERYGAMLFLENTTLRGQAVTVNVTAEAEVPTLSGFGPSATFLENTVNAAPQLLDADVVFAHTETDFSGGSLAVSGLLAEDRVLIRDQGTEPGQIGLTDGVITYGGLAIGVLGGMPGVNLTVTFNAAATIEAIDALIQNLTYANISDTPTASRDLTLTITDALFGAVAQAITVGVTAEDDPAVASTDSFNVVETAVLTGNLFADNGNGADTDPDSPLSIAAINGVAFTFGQPISLDSGALLTVEANGDFTYDPNGVFEYVPAPGSGGLMSFGSDSFTYALAGGSSATVNIRISGVDNDDVVYGKFGAANTLNGGVGDDQLFGASSNDILIGGAGNDILDGGDGIDTADYSGAASGVVARLNRGVTSNDGDGGVDTLISIENLTGSAFADLLVGDAGNNVLTGGLGRDYLIGLDGDDVLIGGSGAANTLQGGRGNDTYVVSANDTLVEFENEGIDTVMVDRAGYTLLTHFENLTYIGDADFRGVGNAADNVILGGAGDDVLIGRGGNDTLNGGDGIDTADYSGVAGGVTASLATGVASADGDGGTDTLISIENLTGSAFADALTGDAGANRLLGGAGDDVLAGGAGTDVLDGGLGRDTADYSNAAAGVDVRLAAAVARDDGDGGTDVLSSIENVTGSVFNDLLFGDAGDNVLNGGLGRDILIGGAGNDTLIGGDGAANQLQGGLGDDLYIVTANDTLVEFANEGIDTVHTTLARYALRDNFENLGFIGDGDFVGTGNAGDNVITGGAGDDVLTGGQGDDILNGGAGDDIAVLSGVLADYAIEHLGGDQYRITDAVGARDGVDLLNGIERVRFGDGSTVLLADLGGLMIALTDKDAAGPQVLPGLIDDGFVLDKDADLPLVLPGADEAFGFDGQTRERIALAREFMLNSDQDGLLFGDPFVRAIEHGDGL